MANCLASQPLLPTVRVWADCQYSICDEPRSIFCIATAHAVNSGKQCVGFKSADCKGFIIAVTARALRLGILA